MHAVNKKDCFSYFSLFFYTLFLGFQIIFFSLKAQHLMYTNKRVMPNRQKTEKKKIESNPD